MRQTRIAQLAQAGSARARLAAGVEQLDTYIAATQLGIYHHTLLALGFIGKPAIATVLEPLLARVLPGANVGLTAHGVRRAGARLRHRQPRCTSSSASWPPRARFQRAEATAWASRRQLFLKAFYRADPRARRVGNGLVRLAGLVAGGGHAAVHRWRSWNSWSAQRREAGVLGEQQERMVAAASTSRSARRAGS